MSDVTILLERINCGDAEAFDLLIPLVYQELRGRAAICFAGRSDGHTLQPTALVHEAFLKLVRHDAAWRDRRHFYRAAAEVMRQILVSHARAKNAIKRGGPGQRVNLDGVEAVESEHSADWAAIDLALHELRQSDERRYQVVTMKYFAGLTDAEVAKSLGISEKTVERDWATAKVFLRARIQQLNEQITCPPGA
jgi:RNA polymerase sigma-70 factor, ECF subfamily